MESSFGTTWPTVNVSGISVAITQSGPAGIGWGQGAGCDAHIAKQDEHVLGTCSTCFDMLALLTRCKHGTQHVECL